MANAREVEQKAIELHEMLMARVVEKFGKPRDHRVMDTDEAVKFIEILGNESEDFMHEQMGLLADYSQALVDTFNNVAEQKQRPMEELTANDLDSIGIEISRSIDDLDFYTSAYVRFRTMLAKTLSMTPLPRLVEMQKERMG